MAHKSVPVAIASDLAFICAKIADVAHQKSALVQRLSLRPGGELYVITARKLVIGELWRNYASP